MFLGFWQQGISPAYVVPGELSQSVPEWVCVLAVPCNVSLSQNTADALKAFFKRGGTLVTESRFGMINEDATLWNYAPGGGLHVPFLISHKLFIDTSIDL